MMLSQTSKEHRCKASVQVRTCHYLAPLHAAITSLMLPHMPRRIYGRQHRVSRLLVVSICVRGSVDVRCVQAQKLTYVTRSYIFETFPSSRLDTIVHVQLQNTSTCSIYPNTNIIFGWTTTGPQPILTLRNPSK